MSFALWLSVSLDIGLVRSGEDFAVCKGSLQLAQALVIRWMFEGVQYSFKETARSFLRDCNPFCSSGYLWQ